MLEKTLIFEANTLTSCEECPLYSSMLRDKCRLKAKLRAMLDPSIKDDMKENISLMDETLAMCENGTRGVWHYDKRPRKKFNFLNS